ncbi:MAG: hypothetical protein ACR2GR_12825 [Rhodothermales bacterium]
MNLFSMKRTLFSMKRTLGWTLALFVFLYAAGCDSTEPEEDDGAGEEEVITDVNLILTPLDGGEPLTFNANFNEQGVEQSKDMLQLTAGVTYSGEVEFLNSFENEDITEEIRDEEPDAHRIFYTPGGDLAGRITISELSTDPNGDPLGVTYNMAVSAGEAVTGTLNVKLRHYEDGAELPGTKQNDDGVAEVPGVVENDVNIDFPVVISAATE